MKAFVSWDFQEDPIFDSEGEEVGSEEYVLIEKVFVPKEMPVQRLLCLCKKTITENTAAGRVPATHSQESNYDHRTTTRGYQHAKPQQYTIASSSASCAA